VSRSATLRAVFASMFLLASVGASLVGAAFAWSANGGAIDTASVGANGMIVLIFPSGSIGPNGQTATVATGRIKNSGDFTLAITGGSVSIDGLTPAAPGGLACAAGDFSGNVIALPPSHVGPGSVSIPDFNVVIATALDRRSDRRETLAASPECRRLAPEATGAIQLRAVGDGDGARGRSRRDGTAAATPETEQNNA